MRYFATFLIPVLAATTLVGCGSDDPIEPPTTPTPVAVTETFSGTLTVNGARLTVSRLTGPAPCRRNSRRFRPSCHGRYQPRHLERCGLHDHHQQYRRRPQHGRDRHRPINRAILRLAQRCRQAHGRCRLLRRRDALLTRPRATGGRGRVPGPVSWTRLILNPPSSGGSKQDPPYDSRHQPRSECRPHRKSEDWRFRWLQAVVQHSPARRIPCVDQPERHVQDGMKKRSSTPVDVLKA